jgi:hypothetical protein
VADPLTFLLPDLSAIGFLAGNRVGALLYNAAHTTAVPVIVVAVGPVATHPTGDRALPGLARPHRHRPSPRLRLQILRQPSTHPLSAARHRPGTAGALRSEAA